MTSTRIPDKYQQVAYRQESRQQALLHNSFWVQCSIVQQMLSLYKFDETNMIPMFRSEVNALRKDECLQLMKQLVRGTTTSWSTGGGIEDNDQGPSLLERGRARKATPGIQKGDQESQDVPRSSTGGSRILPLDRPSGGSAIPLETQEVLFVVEIAERLPEEENSSQKYKRRKNLTSAAGHPNRKEPAQQQSWRRKTWR